MWDSRGSVVAALSMAAASATLSLAAAGPVEAEEKSPIVVAFDDASRPGEPAPAAGDGPAFQVNLCNKSAYQPIWAVVAYRFRPGDREMTAAGWYRIDGATCRPFRGAFGANGRVLFAYYVEWDGGKRVWDGNRQGSVCVSKKVFRRPLSKGYVCGSGEKLVKVHSMSIDRAAPIQSINLN
ncbi:MAG: DUF1036 domain-containing protein [Hyphomicrobiales bacterium]|nr:DUF1036 domain-containing protein [Hyphomicrobiales bacterium]